MLAIDQGFWLSSGTTVETELELLQLLKASFSNNVVPQAQLTAWM